MARVLGVLLVMLLIFPSTGLANSDKRNIGLHDRVLPISDVQVVNGQTVVPLDDFVSHLYVDVHRFNREVRLQKGALQLVYKIETGETYKNGKRLAKTPIFMHNGKLYVGVIIAAQELGFQTHYFAAEKTIRIYRANMPHLSHEQYAKNILSPKKATVYLTFDDGPNQYTKTNLATLNKYNVNGTFFFLGNHIKRQEAIVKQVANEGHYIGSHSMTHDQSRVYRNANTFYSEMHEAARLIEKQTGKSAKLIRVPYGSKPHVTPAMRSKLKQAGYKMWDWDVDSNDWRYSVNQSQQIVKNIQDGVKKAHARGEKEIIVLMHDIGPTAKALPQVIEWLQKEGYSIETYQANNHVVRNFHKDRDL